MCEIRLGRPNADLLLLYQLTVTQFASANSVEVVIKGAEKLIFLLQCVPFNLFICVYLSSIASTNEDTVVPLGPDQWAIVSSYK